MVAAHYAMLSAANREATCPVLDYAWDRPPPFVDRRGRRIRINDTEWFGARRREELRLEARQVADEREREEELNRLRAFLEQQHASEERPPITTSTGSGVFRVVAVHPDPFPSPRAAPARVLVIDDRLSTEEALAWLPDDIDVVPSSDGWTALDRVRREHFDVIVCAVTFSGWTARDFLRLVRAERPAAASRFVLLADASAADTAPSSSATRVLARPLDAQKLLALVEQGRLSRG
jgi:CheY-like chemotaxis protein